jgi:penicillin-binding protein 2
MTPAGAVVVEDVKTGAILASASFPDYSLATYYDDYETLVADDGKPLWNRAFQSAYSPGSTMKPCIAVAALEEGVVTPDEGVYCAGTYQYYDITFACFNNTEHGYVDVETALEYSCNIFFYEMAKRLGIDKMNKYATLFGLGEKTGVEINEAKGILAGPKRRDELGLRWQSGETLLAAIGQSDNSFTPIQLCNYCATIANGGTRWVPYLVSKVLSADYSEVLYERNPEIAVQTNISEETLKAVKEGMYLVANNTSCREQLGGLKYKVACKTGTAEKTRIVDGVRYEGTDGFLIAFAPYDSPEIAITVVVENAGSGASTAQVAADIFTYYFNTLNTV